MDAVIETRPFAVTEGEVYRQRALEAGQAFLKAIDAIAPVLRAGREQSERDCRVPDASVEAMLEAGVFRAFTPLQYGGLELSPADFYDGLMRIAQCDSSAAWIAGQIICHNLEIAAMHPQMHEDFWGVYGPDARASSSYAPLGKTEPVEGGYMLDGRWTFSSGVDFAHYVVLGGGERNFLVPITDLVIDHDSWDVQGMRGTGSKAVTANKVFVPNHRIHVMADVVNDINPGYETITTPLYRGVSWMTVFYATAANTVIGTAMEAVNVFFEQSRNRYTKMGTGARLAENPFVNLKIADAKTRMNDIRMRTLNNWRHIFDQACKGEPISHQERLRVRFESADSFAACFDVVHDIWPMVGAVASQTSNPMQLIYRNLMASRVHGTGGKEFAAIAYSRSLLGLPAPEFKVVDFGAAAYWR
ncbi:acyl-CoA dehydrogenase [Caballeronia sp. ATUFL_M2_KS44]|uniref:acyl-CoA dehydrogenase n=1 Tax=Caballeronia sp. ATUFL_M2_KS44 TaxID=2921767 RepID=UPI002028CCD8|nr:acyl-CoA dehydrogenase [Caballeronia sp. ATUFL_M2_KS44]